MSSSSPSLAPAAHLRQGHPSRHAAALIVAVLTCAFAGAFYGAASSTQHGLNARAGPLAAPASSPQHGGAGAHAKVLGAPPLPRAQPRVPHPDQASPPPPPSTGCTPAQRDAQARALAAAAGGQPDGRDADYMPSACPSASILATLQAADPTAGGALVMVNIGANKGYGIAEVTALWRPDLGVTPASVYADLMGAFPEAGADALLGVCGDGKEAMPTPAATTDPPALVVHAVEPLPVNVPLLRRMARAVADAQPSSPARIFVHPGAVGPDPDAQLGFVPAACTHIGVEACQMAPLRPGLTPVTGWTLDSFFEEHGLQAGSGRQGRSIFLKIDAEGYDGAILLNASTGAGSALDAVRALEFEYHNVGAWRPSKAGGQVHLKDVVAKLDAGAAMDCYLQYGSGLVHLTGTCWTPAYEFRRWSNVLCVRRGDVWAGAAAGLAAWKQG